LPESKLESEKKSKLLEKWTTSLHDLAPFVKEPSQASRPFNSQSRVAFKQQVNGMYSTYAKIQKLDDTGNNDAYGAQKAKLKLKAMKIKNTNERVKEKLRK